MKKDYIDIRDFGAMPGHSNAKITRFAIQNAIDSISIKHSGRPRMVYIPSSDEPWVVDRPIYLDKSYVGITGSHKGGSNIEMAWYNHSPVFLVGIPRSAFGETLNNNNFIDLYNKLDKTAAPSPGKRWGIRTNGNSHIAQNAGPLSYGASNFSQCDYYSKTRQLTVEFAVDYSLTPFHPEYAVYLGMNDRGKPQPFVLIGQQGRYIIIFRTNDGKDRSFSFLNPSGSGVKRFVFQIDLINAQVSVFVDGVQAPTDNRLGDDFKPDKNLSFTSNMNIPFKYAASGFLANSIGSDYFQDNTSKDRTLYGLKISNVIRYVTSGPGQEQKRIDGSKVNDYTCYFQHDNNTIGLFTFQDNPNDVIKDRFLTIQAPSGQSVALFLNSKHKTEWTAKTYNSFRNLSISSHDPSYGDAITLGFALHTDIHKCTLRGGAHGVGCWNWGSNYKTLITRSKIDGNDASIYNYGGMITMRDIEVESLGRTPFWFNLSRAFLSNVFCGYGGTPEYFIRSLNGTQLSIYDFSVDNEENDGYPSMGAIIAETSTTNGGPCGGKLIAKEINLAMLRKDTSAIQLTRFKDEEMKGYFKLDGFGCVGNGYKSIVSNESPNWNGIIYGDNIWREESIPILQNKEGCTGVNII